MNISAQRAADGSLVCRFPDSIFDHFPVDDEHSSELIFLVDSSGSMCSVWSEVARSINEVYNSRRNTHILKWANGGTVRREGLMEDARACAMVDERRGENVGWGTNITAAAQLLRNFVKKLALKRQTAALIVFVSDGHGDTQGLEEECRDIRKETDAARLTLEMTTLGIGCGFPTHIAMSIRNHLHSGRANLPLISIVADQGDFQEALEGLSEFTQPRNVAVKILDSTELRTSPWSEASKSVELGVNVLLPADTVSLKIGPCEGFKGQSKIKELEVSVQTEPWNEENIVVFAKQLTWQLQAMSLKGEITSEIVKQRAQTAFQIVSTAADEVTANEAARKKMAECTDTGKRSSVFDRVARKKTGTTRLVLNALRKELRELVDGSPLDSLSDEQLKQRLAIGTMEGKFHERAMSFKGLSGDDFMERVREFISLLRDENKVKDAVALANVEEEAGLRSAFTLESNVDVWEQEQLVEALEKLTSQYALVECLPLIGLAVNVVRTSASMINPWASRVDHMSTLTPVLDSLSILTLDGGKAQLFKDGLKAFLNLGEDETEVVNAICCVVCSTEHAAVSRPFLTSRLYQVLHTHNTCGNVDTSDATSHPAMLAAVACYFLDQKYSGLAKDSTWFKMSLLSLRTLYPSYGVQGERGYVSALIRDSGEAVVTESPGIRTKCPSMSKPIALSLSWMREIPVDSRQAIFANIVKEWVGRVVGSRRSISDWFSLTEVRTRMLESESGQEVSVDSIAARLDVMRFYTTVAALKALPDVVPTLRAEVRFASLQFDRDNLLREDSRDGAVSFKTLVQFGRLFLEKRFAEDHDVISESDLKRYVVHAVRYSSSLDRCQHHPSDSFEEALATAPLVREVKRTLVTALRDDVRAAVKARWKEAMSVVHPQGTTHPLSLSQLQEARAARGLMPASAEALGYRADVGLCSRACMCSACPYYLEEHGEAALHYNEADPGAVTAFSIAVAACVRGGLHDPWQVMDAVRSGKHMQFESPEKLERVQLELTKPGRWTELIATVEGLVPVYKKLANGQL